MTFRLRVCACPVCGPRKTCVMWSTSTRIGEPNPRNRPKRRRRRPRADNDCANSVCGVVGRWREAIDPSAKLARKSFSLELFRLLEEAFVYRCRVKRKSPLFRIGRQDRYRDMPCITPPQQQQRLRANAYTSRARAEPPSPLKPQTARRQACRPAHHQHQL